jgi:hypothetical protein
MASVFVAGRWTPQSVQDSPMTADATLTSRRFIYNAYTATEAGRAGFTD